MNKLLANTPTCVLLVGSLIVIARWWLIPQMQFAKRAKALQLGYKLEGRVYSYWSDTPTRLNLARQNYAILDNDADSPQIRELKREMVEAHRRIAVSLKPCITRLFIVLLLTIASGILTNQFR
jgi:hypothetical protein